MFLMLVLFGIFEIFYCLSFSSVIAEVKCDTLRNLVALVQYKKRKKHPWRSVNFSKVGETATLLKLTLLHGCFSCFLNCTNASKLCNASQMF